MSKNIFFAAVMAVVVSACAGSNFDWDKARQVKAGMSEQEVVALLGPPNAVRAAGSDVTWAWVHVNGMTATTRTVSVVFRDGRVVSAPPIPESFK